MKVDDVLVNLVPQNIIAVSEHCLNGIMQVSVPAYIKL